MMLTQAELDEIRLLAGDDCTPPLVSDDQLQTWYDRYDHMDCVIAKVIQVRVSKAAGEAGVDFEGRAVASPLAAGLQTLYKTWAARCPALSTSTVSYSTLDLGIDEDRRS